MTGRSSTVLVVDDDPAVLNLLRLALEAEHYRVLVTTGGDEGFEAACAHQPDLITLDTRMPGHDGWEIARRLRDDQRTALIPLMFLTAAAEPLDFRRGWALGADAYLPSPWASSDLTRLVAHLLGRDLLPEHDLLRRWLRPS